MDSIPFDCLYDILSWLPLSDRFRVNLVSEKWDYAVRLLNSCQQTLSVWAKEENGNILFNEWISKLNKTLLRASVMDKKLAESVIENFPHITSVQLYLIQVTMDAADVMSSNLSRLKTLGIYGWSHSNIDAIVRSFATNSDQLKSLEVFLMTENGVTEDTMQLLTSRCQGLQHIAFCKLDSELPTLTGHFLKHLKDLKTLYMFNYRTLDICDLVKTNGSNLQRLGLDINDAKESEMVPLICQHLKNLKSLTLSFNSNLPTLSSSYLMQIGNLKNLVELSFFLMIPVPDSVVNDEVLEHIQQCCTKMKVFCIYYDGEILTKKCVSSMAQHWPQLEVLTFASYLVDDEWCPHMAKLKELRYLNLTSSVVKDGVLTLYDSLQKLQFLDLSLCVYVSPATIEKVTSKARITERGIAIIIPKMGNNDGLVYSQSFLSSSKRLTIAVADGRNFDFILFIYYIFYYYWTTID